MAEAMSKNNRVDDLRNRISASMKNLSSQGLLNYQLSKNAESKLSGAKEHSRQVPIQLTQKIHTLKVNVY